jgi:hypothetical protein
LAGIGALVLGLVGLIGVAASAVDDGLEASKSAFELLACPAGENIIGTLGYGALSPPAATPEEAVDSYVEHEWPLATQAHPVVTTDANEAAQTETTMTFVADDRQYVVVAATTTDGGSWQVEASLACRSLVQNTDGEGEG